MSITHKALFERLRDDSLIYRCTHYAHWTLPKLMADMSVVTGTNRAVVERDYQEIGALLVNNLSSKLARLLFPANLPYFRVEPSKELTREAEAEGRLAELTSKLASLELGASQRVFSHASYSQLILAVAHLVVTGNCALYRDSADGRTACYGLQSYVTRRDGKGIVLDAVVREFTYVEALPLDVQEYLRRANPSKYGRPEQRVELYTRVHRQQKEAGWVYEITQQVDVHPVGEPSVYPDYLCPWMFPTWSLILALRTGAS